MDARSHLTAVKTTLKCKNLLLRVIFSFLKLISTLNNFIFNYKNILQIKGCAMGTKYTSTCAKIFMGKLKKHPNRHTTSNQRRFGVDITSIRGRPNFDEFPRHFHVLLRCNFANRKIHVVSTYVFRCNFDGRKIHVVSTYFFQCNFHGRKICIVSTVPFSM